MRMEGSLAQSGPRASQPSLVLTACLTWLGPGHPPQLQGFFFFLSFVLFGSHCTACRILVPQPEIKPGPSAVKAWSPNHWTSREVPQLQFYT